MASTDTHAYDPQALRAWLRLQLTPGVSHVYGYRLLRALDYPRTCLCKTSVPYAPLSRIVRRWRFYKSLPS